MKHQTSIGQFIAAKTLGDKFLARMNNLISPKEYWYMPDAIVKQVYYLIFSKVLTAHSSNYILFPSTLLLFNSY